MTAQALMFSRGSFVSGNISSGTTQFNSNGTISGGSYSGPANWFLPGLSGVGAGYWVRVTRTSGTSGVTFGATQGLWVSLSAGQSYSATGGAGGCSGNWEIAPNSGGAPVLASGTISVNNAL